MKALVVDDDRVLADVVSFTLRRAGFEVVLAHDGRAALDRFREDTPQIVILDLELPEMDGLEVCRTIRAQADTPIIMLTVRDGDEDVVRGLEIGADDYITKPFSPTQLVARAQAVVRRSGQVSLPKRLSFAGMTLDSERHAVSLDDSEPIPLTALEYRLLETFVLNREQVLPFDMLIDRVWGPDGGDKAMLKQLVYRLRRKIEPEEGGHAVYLEAIPGIGYALMRGGT
ncbi:MAG TPA: response regulator transcription factor [Phototrophicaceae bacterium]|nr:response regulator transcription factor [Phototrophicaceae bacterium]